MAGCCKAHWEMRLVGHELAQGMLDQPWPALEQLELEDAAPVWQPRQQCAATVQLVDLCDWPAAARRTGR